MRATGAAILMSLAATQAAGDFFLSFPVDCTLGDDCFIQQYVDHDPDTGSHDFMCGPLTYDAHSGTDVALIDMDAMAQGVEVLAAADGIVIGVRNNEPDTGMSGFEPGKDCGNGAAVDHGDGWVTQYCHLKEGSLRVDVGQTVASGTPLGDIGFSGRTEFPHLHISVRKDGEIVDPFAPDNQNSCGDATAEPLWATPIPYQPGGIVSLGLADHVPDFELVKEGSVPELEMSPSAPAVVLYAHLFGTRQGDVISLKLDNENGEVFGQDFVIEKTQARSFRAIGRRAPESGWPVGLYEGHASFIRADTIVGQTTLQFQITP